MFKAMAYCPKCKKETEHKIYPIYKHDRPSVKICQDCGHEH